MGGSLTLWMIPDEPLRSRLEVLAAELAARLRTPAFAPHVTLLSGIGGDEADALARARELARRSPLVPLWPATPNGLRSPAPRLAWMPLISNCRCRWIASPIAAPWRCSPTAA